MPEPCALVSRLGASGSIDIGLELRVPCLGGSVMPIILWFLGVPIGIIILLMLFGVLSF